MVTLVTVSCLYFPVFGLVLLVLNFLLALYISTQRLKLAYANEDLEETERDALRPKPFVSIHIAVCKEPVNSVIKTVKAASRLDYENYEVIVYYNNTPEAKLVRPVELVCKYLSNVRFYNCPEVEGYKAGALNKCREIMHPHTDLIFTVDADYILKPTALTAAVEEFYKKDVDLLQFPQSYTNHQENNALALEFQHYFKFYSTKASKERKNLPTGTLTLVTVECLDAIDGWPENSITEDAYLGVQMLKQGYTIGYCDMVIGQGIMPSSTSDLKTQRMRWIFGNFQVLVHALRLPGLKLKTKSLVATQLTSWINLNGLPWLFVIAVAMLLLTGILINASAMLSLALATIYMNSICSFVTFWLSLGSLRSAGSAFLVHVANSVEGAYAWWGYLLNPSRPFARTNKFSKGVGVDLEQVLFNSLLFLSGMIVFTFLSAWLGGFILFSAIARFTSRLHLYYALKNAQPRNNIILPK
jgi:cellulose synthase/poly-beta-1,6-N-acetylglucosamine synthase-like glycosyltransferase